MKVNTSLNNDFEITLQCRWKWLLFGCVPTLLFSTTPLDTSTICCNSAQLHYPVVDHIQTKHKNLCFAVVNLQHNRLLPETTSRVAFSNLRQLRHVYVNWAKRKHSVRGSSAEEHSWSAVTASNKTSLLLSMTLLEEQHCSSCKEFLYFNIVMRCRCQRERITFGSCIVPEDIYLWFESR